MTDPFRLADRLAQRAGQHLYRQRRTLQSPQSPLIQCDGADLVNFCSNDYLSLANDPALIRAGQMALAQFGAGSGASHLVVGHSALHHELEKRLADWVGRPRALLFSSGYMANLGVISALLGRDDVLLEDKLNHASLLDGAQLSRARRVRYQHGDVQHLRTRLDSIDSPALVVTDSVFSMDGDVAPLKEIADLCRQQGHWLMIDDAHGLGVLGQGRGALFEYGLGVDDVPVYMGTLGKALGSYGAFVAGSDNLIEFLIQFARPYIYTTAIPPSVAATTLAALDCLQSQPERVQHLHERIALFRDGAKKRGLKLMPSETAIQPLLVGDADKAMAMSARLQSQGFLVGAIRPPTVPSGTARLRITLQSGHSEQQIHRLLDALQDITGER